MTVKELIEALSKMPAELEVKMEQQEDSSFDKIGAVEYVHRVRNIEDDKHEEYMVLLRNPWDLNDMGF